LFQECLNFHQCSGSVSSAMPTRLVDIGSAAESVPPRLVDTESELISAPYATLSYCWGGTNQLQLTESSLEEFKLQIPASQLSFTILDAVHVVRQLKLRYLWVDSLCIIQDSKSDWAKEVITMGEVFRNSAITISALGAKHSKEGLFARRDPLIYLPCNLFQRDGRDFFVTSHVSDSQFSDDWFEKGPLHQRGWVMQERALSPRTLNFGATVVWECSKGVKYEHGTGFELETSFTDSPDNSTIKSKLHEPLKVEVTPDQSRFLLNFWKEKILKPYTMTILTVKEDRLAAISGVIDLIGKSSGWESVYGLWKPFLAEELLWHKFIFVPWRGDWRHQNNKEKLGQSRLGIAPTWSWASLD
ncbi:HET-domain-containing protein, partial [Stipitochalara longipes BDJ]